MKNTLLHRFRRTRGVRRGSNEGRRRRRLRRERAGAVLIELALLLPLLITIVLACIDFGRLAYTHIAVTNAAREGAYIGSFNPVTTASLPNWEAVIQQATLNELAQLELEDIDNNRFPESVGIVATLIKEDGRNDRVRVSVSYPFETIVNWPGIPSDVTISRAVEMRFIR